MLQRMAWTRVHRQLVESLQVHVAPSSQRLLRRHCCSKTSSPCSFTAKENRNTTAATIQIRVNDASLVAGAKSVRDVKVTKKPPVKKIAKSVRDLKVTKETPVKKIPTHVATLHQVQVHDRESHIVQITWSDGTIRRFHALFLRAYCPCEACVHVTSQRLCTPLDFPLDLAIESVQIVENKMHVKWSDSEHLGIFSSEWLIENGYMDADLKKISQTVQPVMLESVSEVEELAYDHFMKEDESGVLDLLHQVVTRGICFIKNVPLEQESITRVAKRIAPISHSFLYGETFDVASKADAENIAYTNEKLDFHMDLAYYESPPGLQLLHCFRLDDDIKGGESTFMDSNRAAEILREEDPDAFRVLTQIPATFVKRHLMRDNPAIMEYQRPHIAVNHLDEVIGVYWSPPFEGVLQVPFKDVMPYYQAYQKLAAIIEGRNGQPDRSFQCRMSPGDLVVFNNRRILHGRTSFESKSGKGIRHLRGTYLNIDEILCRYHVLREFAGTGIRSATRVFNQSFT